MSKSTSRMLSRCCIGLTCSCEQVIRSCKLGGETRDVSHCFKEDRTEAFEEVTRMDIARLKEQYLWIKEKQKYQTRVVFFKKAPNNEEICGKSLINMVPVSQDIRNPKAFEEQLPVKEIQYNFVYDLDNDKNPWRTHLGIHRMTHPGSWIKASDTNISRTPNPTRPLTATKDFCECTGESQEAESITSEKCGGLQCLERGDQSEQVTPASRKSNFPEALSKQHSVAEHRPSLPSLNSHHYPFPQRKCPKKSEAARRLGMYSSF